MILAFYFLLFPRSDGTMDIKAIIDMAIKTATMSNYGKCEIHSLLTFLFLINITMFHNSTAKWSIHMQQQI